MAQASLVTYVASIGGFQPIAHVDPSAQLDIMLWLNPIKTLAVFAFIPSKCSVAWLLLRIMRPLMVWRKWLLYFLMATLVVVNSLDMIFIWVLCEPVAAAWNPAIKGTCWNPQILAIFGQTNNGGFIARQGQLAHDIRLEHRL